MYTLNTIIDRDTAVTMLYFYVKQAKNSSCSDTQHAQVSTTNSTQTTWMYKERHTGLSSFSTEDFPGSYSNMLLGSARYFLVSTFLSGGSHSFLQGCMETEWYRKGGGELLWQLTRGRFGWARPHSLCLKVWYLPKLSNRQRWIE